MVNSSGDAHDCVHAHPEIRAGAKDTLLRHAKHQMQHIAGLASNCAMTRCWYAAMNPLKAQC